jgi:hypothetical protein
MDFGPKTACANIRQRVVAQEQSERRIKSLKEVYMSFRGAIFTIAAALCVTLPSEVLAQAKLASPAPAAAAAAAADPAIMARAKEWLHRIQTGDIDRTQLDSKMDSLLTPTMTKQISSTFGPWGDPVAFTYVGKQTILGDNTAYVFHVVFKANACNEIFVLDKDGKISGLRLPAAP